MAARREDVLNSLSQIARKFRTRLGESLATVEKHSTPLAEATTPSLEALKAYSTGHEAEPSLRALRRPYPSSGALSKSIRNSRWRTRYLGLAYSTIGESVLSAESTTKAWRLRDRVSDRERFFIDFTYDRQVTGNLEKAYQTLELWLQTYPRGEETKCAGSVRRALPPMGPADYERAIEASQRRNRGGSRLHIRICHSCAELFFPGSLRRSREHSSAQPPSASWKFPLFCSSTTTSPC